MSIANDSGVSLRTDAQLHLSFHPAAQRVKEIIDSGELGKLKNINSDFALPKLPSGLFFLEDDVRFQFELGGGVTMDMGGKCIVHGYIFETRC